MRALLAMLVVTPLILAGCLGGDAPADADDVSIFLPDLAGVPPPVLDAAQLADWHADFVTTYIHRETGSPVNKLVSDLLIEELRALGWDAELVEYAPTGIELPTDTGLGINVVVGVREGANPDHVIGWGAHYDTVPQTIEGAYDNGSGTAMALALARELAEYENNKTLVVMFFDSEEIGLLASDYFVQGVVASDDARWDLVLGFDMVGINCPGHEWPLIALPNLDFDAEMRPVLEALMHGRLQRAPGCAVIPTEDNRNSDERRFREAGIPTLRFAGGHNASDYPEYHRPMDTVAYIEEFVGGRENWEAGLAATLEAAYWSVATWDQLAPMRQP